jgi:hypothetical protein
MSQPCFSFSHHLKEMETNNSTSSAWKPWVFAAPGLHSTGNQRFPPYDARLAVACSEDQYNELMNALQEYMDQNSCTSDCQTWVQICGVFTLCIPLCAANWWVSNYTSRLKDITKAKTKTWSCEARIQLMNKDETRRAAMVPDQTAYDQHGQPLIVTNLHGSAPEWPPLGYNVILVLPMKLGFVESVI